MQSVEHCIGHCCCIDVIGSATCACVTTGCGCGTGSCCTTGGCSSVAGNAGTGASIPIKMWTQL